MIIIGIVVLLFIGFKIKVFPPTRALAVFTPNPYYETLKVRSKGPDDDQSKIIFVYGFVFDVFLV